MNRDIKLRIWDPEQKCFLVDNAEYEFFVSGKSFQSLRVIRRMYDMYDGEIKDAVIQQFIGIKDTSGVDTYEGDIIEYNDTQIGGFHGLGEVMYNTDLCFAGAPCFGIWSFQLLSNKNLKTGQNGIGWGNLSFNFKVIGNIFTNPEYLDYKENNGLDCRL